MNLPHALAKSLPGSPLKALYAGLGLLSLALGIVGAFLPILPTTPLVLLAAFFFSRSSPALHQMLLRNRMMGPMIRDWQRYGVIRLRAKIAATVMIVLLCGYTLVYVAVPLLVKGVVGVVCASVLGFIWSRPSGGAASEES